MSIMNQTEVSFFPKVTKQTNQNTVTSSSGDSLVCMFHSILQSVNMSIDHCSISDVTLTLCKRSTPDAVQITEWEVVIIIILKVTCLVTLDQ